MPHDVLRAAEPDGPGSAEVRRRVSAARERQLARAGKLNHALTPREIPRHCRLEPQALQVLERATERLGLSARAYHRLIKVARTIADLAEGDLVTAGHVSEAVAYRRLDRGTI